MNRTPSQRGFTLIELLVVIAIIGILASIVMMALDDSRRRGNDSARKVEIQEIIKALELRYGDTGTYPTMSDSDGDDLTVAALQGQFIGTGAGMYLKRVPNEAERYHYCVSSDLKSMMIAVNTDDDHGGSDYCSVFRGSDPDFGGGCNAWITANANDGCASRF